MATKKQKRQVSSVPAATSTVEVERPAFSSTRSRATASDFNPDYSAVKKDLRRIGTLAGTFFVILVALSFFLR